MRLVGPAKAPAEREREEDGEEDGEAKTQVGVGGKNEDVSWQRTMCAGGQYGEVENGC